MSGICPSIPAVNHLLGHRLSNRYIRPLIKVGLPLLLFTLISTNAYAASVSLAWDPNDPAPDGYMILIRVEGAAYNYNAPAWIGATTSCTMEGLVPGTTYYLVVRAYVGAAQSGDSNEISYTPTDPGTNISESTNNSSNRGASAEVASRGAKINTASSGTTTTNGMPTINSLQVVSAD